jgi:5'-3' exonuclease
MSKEKSRKDREKRQNEQRNKDFRSQGNNNYGNNNNNNNNSSHKRSVSQTDLEDRNAKRFKENLVPLGTPNPKLTPSLPVVNQTDQNSQKTSQMEQEQPQLQTISNASLENDKPTTQKDEGIVSEIQTTVSKPQPSLVLPPPVNETNVSDISLVTETQPNESGKEQTTKEITNSDSEIQTINTTEANQTLTQSVIQPVERETPEKQIPIRDSSSSILTNSNDVDLNGDEEHLDNIRLGEEGWKKRYYCAKFEVELDDRASLNKYALFFFD